MLAGGAAIWEAGGLHAELLHWVAEERDGGSADTANSGPAWDAGENDASGGMAPAVLPCDSKDREDDTVAARVVLCALEGSKSADLAAGAAPSGLVGSEASGMAAGALL